MSNKSPVGSHHHITPYQTYVKNLALLLCLMAATIWAAKQSFPGGTLTNNIVAMGIALQPALCTSSSEHYVEIETANELTRGMTVVDRLNVATDSRNREVWADTIERQRKVHVCWTLDIPKWKGQLFSALG